MIARSIFWLLAFTACLSAAGAEPEKVYEPIGAPADPQVPASWNRYHDYQQATALLHALAEKHPRHARLQSLGKSYGGREMWVLTVTNFTRGDAAEKPAFWIDGAIHANEIQATEVVLYTAWYLLEMYGRTDAITRLVDERTFYLMPMMSPDSRDAHMYRPNTTHSPRSGQRPVDDDRDGLADEDGPDDLDGDGSITQMRVADPLGRWKPSPEFPNLLVQADADEPGTYRLLGEEGFDNDGDGRVNEDGDGYYDPNRDWPWDWQPDYVQGGAYRYPLSIDENRMVADFILGHPNIAGAQSYHNAGGMILRGPGAKEETIPAADVAVYDAIARRGETMLPGYKYLITGRDLYSLHGGLQDWFYRMRGVYAFTNELFTPFNFFRQKSEEGFFGKAEDARRFDKYLLFGEGTVPWHEVDHPQYGRVEVGGLKKQWLRQPPSFLLEEECHRNMAFTLYHADQMPLVRIDALTARSLGGGLTEITATVANPKVTPTHAASDLEHHITPPDRVKIEGKGLEVIAGLWSSDPAFLSAHDDERQPSVVEVPTIGGMSGVYVRWIVRGDGPAVVSVDSVKGGRAKREVRW